ncbi:MAG: 3-hydroxyacid dehydrogenase, partial [Ramlibacter sp.]|nr:3-hydroxyacid dehydrogenase [Ramlibacter sp.]
MTGTVGIVGVGNMGGAMAARLLECGWQVQACDLVRSRVDALVAQGGHAAP